MEHTGVTIVAGFLGSGKTTLLSRIVRSPDIGPHVGVIVNELGALGLDEELIRSHTSSANLRTAQLTSGCICCTLRGELVDALRELAERPDRPRHLLIETSGAALASEVSYGINAISFELPFRTDAVVTLVDAHNAARCHAEHAALFEDQVRSADLLVLNKADLLPDEGERIALLSWLRPLAPRASWLFSEHAALSPELLLGMGLLPGEPHAGHRDHGDHAHHAPGSGTGRTVGHGFESLTLLMPPRHDDPGGPSGGPSGGQATVSRAALEDVLDELSETVFRIKGVVHLTDEGPALVQVVGDRIEIDVLPPGSPLASSAQRLIFIGVGVARREAQLRAALAQAAR